MSRFAAAAALACTVVLVSTPSHARPGFRFFSSASKIVPVKPAAAAAAPSRSSVFFAVGSRPETATPQQAVGDPGPSLYKPTPVSAEAKPAPTDSKAEAPKELTAAPSTDCVMKEPAKETVAAQEPAKAEPPRSEPASTERAPVRSRSAFLVPVANRHPQAPRRPVVCYMQRDGTCVP